jgi:hypothetical protein
MPSGQDKEVKAPVSPAENKPNETKPEEIKPQVSLFPKPADNSAGGLFSQKYEAKPEVNATTGGAPATAPMNTSQLFAPSGTMSFAPSTNTSQTGLFGNIPKSTEQQQQQSQQQQQQQPQQSQQQLTQQQFQQPQSLFTPSPLTNS